MYTRSYAPDDEKLTLPTGYDGTAFEKDTEQPEERECIKREEKSETGAGILSRIPLFRGSGSLEKFKLPFDINSEDLVLIAVALLLFFTKEGDRECALMIALLLFIK